MNKAGQNCEFLHAGEFFSGLSIRFVCSMMTMNWAVSLQHLLFRRSLRSCRELYSTYFSVCQTICMTDSVSAVKEFKTILST